MKLKTYHQKRTKKRMQKMKFYTYAEGEPQRVTTIWHKNGDTYQTTKGAIYERGYILQLISQDLPIIVYGGELNGLYNLNRQTS